MSGKKNISKSKMEEDYFPLLYKEKQIKKFDENPEGLGSDLADKTLELMEKQT